MRIGRWENKDENGEKEKGENCIKMEVKCLKITCFWVINTKKFRNFIRRRKNLRVGRGGGGNDLNAQYIPLLLY